MLGNVILAVITLIVGRWLGIDWPFVIGGALGHIVPFTFWRVTVLTCFPLLLLFDSHGHWWAYAGVAAFWLLAWHGWPASGKTWVTFGRNPAEWYRPGLTFYRYPGRYTSQWYAVLLLDGRRFKFKVRCGLIKTLRTFSDPPLSWMWPSTWAVDRGVFFERWDQMDDRMWTDEYRLWLLQDGGPVRGRSDFDRMVQWLDDVEKAGNDGR